MVTGGGNGIGRRVVLELVARGGIVAAVDLNEVGLAETASQANVGDRLSTHVLDVSDVEAVAAFPAQIIEKHGRVDGLFNIAGIAQEFETAAGVTDRRIERLMNVNFYGTVRMTRAFLPHLEARPDGGVVMLTSSLSALVPVPGAATYGASKAAVAMFGYGLAQDLRGQKSSVTATTVIPGTIWTDIVSQSATKIGAPQVVAKAFAMAPEKAAHRMIESTCKGKMRVIIGKDAHAFNVFRRFGSGLAERASYLQVGTFVYRKKSDG